jgi:hypothetical protein
VAAAVEPSDNLAARSFNRGEPMIRGPKLVIPEKLKVEFSTVESLWASAAQTRRTDSLVLAWVKYEKQLRRLFCFLVFQHPVINEQSIDSVIGALAENRDLNPRTFIVAIKALGVTPIPELLAKDHTRLSTELSRIQKIRNKLMHGQITGQKISSRQLERDVILLIDWINCLADAAEREFGYDGLRRNSFRKAKSVAKINVAKYPFNNVSEFKNWLRALSKKGR